MIPDYTIVLGLDYKHLSQLKLVIPTWKKHKPSLFSKKWIVFIDNSVDYNDVEVLLDSYGVSSFSIRGRFSHFCYRFF